MYIPRNFRENDSEAIQKFLEQNPFGMLVSCADLEFSFVPVLRRTESIYEFHLAKNNPQCEVLSQDSRAKIVFMGPHAYISPSWYSNQTAVPTWNYAIVVVEGRVTRMTEEMLLKHVSSQVEVYESHRPSPWKLQSQQEQYLERLLKAIDGFELEATSIEAKFKLGQNKSKQDIEGVLYGLSQETHPSSKAFHLFMKEYYSNLENIQKIK